jgi:hypothetical protein
MSLSSPPLTAEQILNRVEERGRSALDTAISLAAFAVACVEECNAETRAQLAWYLKTYARSLDGSESGGVSH